MTGSAVIQQPSWERSCTARTVVEADREHVTLLLRRLAARLDELDRRLADLLWRQQRSVSGPGAAQTVCEQTALESERHRLADRLGVLARQLNALDHRLSDSPALPAGTTVGTCPYCGYPSLGSGLCAFCRPDLAR